MYTYENCPSITNQASICLLSFGPVGLSLSHPLAQDSRDDFSDSMGKSAGRHHHRQRSHPSHAARGSGFQGRRMASSLSWLGGIPVSGAGRVIECNWVKLLRKIELFDFPSGKKGLPGNASPLFNNWFISRLMLPMIVAWSQKVKEERKRAVSDRAQLGTGTTTEWLECYGGGVARCAEGAVKILQEKGDRCLVKTMICICIYIYIHYIHNYI